MFVTFISLFLVVALLVLFGWLTYRSIRAKRMWVKIAGGLGAGLLTLVFAAVTFFSVKGLAYAYIPPAPVPDITVEGTPEQIARGEYLTNLSCKGCHGANGSENFPLSGGLDLAKAEGFDFAGKMVAANLTPAGILAERTDGELFRAIRYGYGKNQRAGVMSFIAIRQLSDEDIKSIIAFLRTQEPVETETNGGDDVNLLGVIVFFGSGMLPLPADFDGVIHAPPPGETAEYGRYVATLGDCAGCHGANMTGAPASPAGGAVPNPRPYVSSITREQFIEMMHTGVRPNKVPFSESMPWQNAALMTDDDLAALYVHLTSPVE